MTNSQETTLRDGAPHTAVDAVRMRRRKAQWLVSGMLSLSLLIVVMGIYISTRTESVSITGYMSGILLAFGSFLGVLGLCLEENRKQLLIAAIVFLSFGIISSFLCLLVDGVFILLNIDMRPMRAGRCQFYTSGNSYIYENYYATVSCQGLTESCDLKVRSGTCYCCDLYDCANGGYLNNYYEFVGVQSCQEVLSLYVLLWILTALNLLAFVFGILTTAVLGSFKDMVWMNEDCQRMDDDDDHKGGVGWSVLMCPSGEVHLYSPLMAPTVHPPLHHCYWTLTHTQDTSSTRGHHFMFLQQSLQQQDLVYLQEDHRIHPMYSPTLLPSPPSTTCYPTRPPASQLRTSGSRPKTFTLPLNTT